MAIFPRLCEPAPAVLIPYAAT